MHFFNLQANFTPGFPHLDPDPYGGRCGSRIRFRITTNADPHNHSNPNHIPLAHRSVAGSYDNEGIAIFCMLFTYYLWIKAVKTGYMYWAALCSLAYFYMVSSWGGYVFLINIIPLHVLGRLVPYLVRRGAGILG